MQIAHREFIRMVPTNRRFELMTSTKRPNPAPETPATDTHTLQVPHSRWLPDGGVAETRKAPSFKGSFFHLWGRVKRAPSVVSGDPPLF